MGIVVRALGFTGLLMLAVYSGQPIHAWLLRVQAGYDHTQQQRNLVSISANFSAMKSALTVIMATVLSDTPSFSRVRVAVIHNQIVTDPTSPLVSDSIVSLATADHLPGELATNVPIAQLSDFLGDLLYQKCVYVPVTAISHLSVTGRMQGLGIQAFLGCPIVNEKGELLGVIYGNWDLLTDVPDDLEPIKKRLLSAGRKIGSTVKLVN